MTTRILAVGTETWSDRRATTLALREVAEKYRGPFTLITEDTRSGASRHALIAAEKLGWQIETYRVDGKCDDTCNDGHRREASPGNDYCPTARYRAVCAQLEANPDLLLVFRRVTKATYGTRMGQRTARQRGIAIKDVVQIEPRKDAA